jgi:hypothetical protein
MLSRDREINDVLECFNDLLVEINNKYGCKAVVIIDEYDKLL